MTAAYVSPGNQFPRVLDPELPPHKSLTGNNVYPRMYRIFVPHDLHPVVAEDAHKICAIYGMMKFILTAIGFRVPD